MSLHSFPAKRREFCGVVMGKLTLFIAFNADHHRLKDTALATIDRHNGAAGRSSEQHAGIFFILKERLPFDNAIALLNQHRGTHSQIIVAYDGDMTDTCTGRNVLLGHACNRQIKSFFYFKHVVSRFP